MKTAVEVRPVTREEVERVQNSMKDMIEKVNRDVAEYMKSAEDYARLFATRKKRA
ncbi:MAG TPA: hypothetical protein VF903_07405 [Nitrospirota bacterium]